VYSYRLIYRIDPTRILVTAVIHGKRLLDDATVNRLAEK
jgi:mRNA-degrading endonuclease RelE of RelBE toxin-antitoxin system